ncbi:hypothetical protein ASH00_14690 [Arthrobacter sp. Soil782]|nr:hypothetical protein ASH00_14690 [Arthrobacter sp. Soil782]
MPSTHHASLREAARGDDTGSAGTEMLIRAFSGRFAAPGNPWVIERPEGAYVDFSLIKEGVGPLSSGERKFLLMAASIGGGVEVKVADAVSSLDRDLLALVLTGIAPAAGSHHSGVVVENPDGSASFRRMPTVFDWPGRRRQPNWRAFFVEASSTSGAKVSRAKEDPGPHSDRGLAGAAGCPQEGLFLAMKSSTVSRSQTQEPPTFRIGFG